MYIAIGNTNAENTITIYIGKLLDRSAYNAFIRVCRLAKQSNVHSIIVDLSETTGIRASGLGMLLMLRVEAESMDVNVLLGGCHPEISHQISASRLLAGFSHADAAPSDYLTQETGADQQPKTQG